MTPKETERQLIDRLCAGALGVEYTIDGVKYRLRLGGDQKHYLTPELTAEFFRVTATQIKADLTKQVEELRKLAADAVFHGAEEFEI